MAAKKLPEITSGHFWPRKFGFRLVTVPEALPIISLWTLQAQLASSAPAELQSDPRAISKAGDNTSQAKDRKSEALWSERTEIKSIAMH